MRTRTTFGALRLAGAVLCVAALIHRLFWGLSSGTFAGQNFLAYLTIQSNLAFLAVSIVAGVAALRTPWDPHWLTTTRATVLACTVTAGIVFALLIQQAGAQHIRVDVPWSDIVLHFWLPAFAVVDWVAAPGRGVARWRAIPIAVGYPLVWGVVTMVRGAFVGWYPYFFLDPLQVSGPLEFVLLSAGALAVFAVVCTALVVVTRTERAIERHRRHRERHERLQAM